MIIFHCYRKMDGILTGASVGAVSKEAIAGNETAEIGLIEGVTDWLCQRVDLSTLQLVAYQPPAPDADHEWNGSRWVIKQEVAERHQRKASALAEIAELEGKQARVFREYFLGVDGPAAKSRLHDIEHRISELRKQLA